MKMVTERKKLIDVFPDKVGKIAQRLHQKKEDIPYVKKYYVADKQEKEEKERAVVSYISTSVRDRDGDVLLPEGVQLDNYRKNPVVFYGHDYRGVPVGKNAWIKPDDVGLRAKTFFANTQRGEELHKAYTEDIEGLGPLLAGWSVGFIPLEWEDIEVKDKSKEKPGKKYTKWELLEYSAVGIPSCPEALTIAEEKGLIPKSVKKDIEYMIAKDEPKEEKELEVVEDVDPMSKSLIDGIAKGMKMEKVETEWVIEKDEEIDFTEHNEELVKHLIAFEDADKITKPETTDQYHRIPVNPGCEVTATITISASQGIKAIYCGKVKKVHTYLFDVNKWTMEEAKKWVADHKDFEDIEIKEPEYKERWNKSLSKLFDVVGAESSIPLSFNYDLYEKFLECKVKNVFQNNYSIPCPLMGTYLVGFRKTLGAFKLIDTRNFNYRGEEHPPQHEVVQLNSEKSDTFLIQGMVFYNADGKPLIAKFSLGWCGIEVGFITSNENREWNKNLMNKVHSWVQENNFLKGEKFSLSGEFLKERKEEWGSLILYDKYKDPIKKSADMLEKKKEDMVGRGLLLIGPPGTGKTKTGRILMTNIDSTFIWISSRDFRHIGPLKAITMAYSLARDLAPSVLFIEDIDTWLKDSGNRDSVVVDLIKTEMDGLRQNKGILTIMTSNYPEKLPDALLDRPGRFHHIINYELPKKEQRQDMFAMWIGDIEKELLDEIIEKTEGFSGAHLKELIEFAKIISEEDEIEIGEALLKSLKKLMEQRELIDEIRDNKTDAKDFWDRVKLTGDVLTRQKEASEQGEIIVPVDIKSAVAVIKEQYEKLLDEKDEHIADLKEGRVLSRKHREVVKDAVVALQAVLKADATGSREDEEQEETSKGKTLISEPHMEIIKNDEQITPEDIDERVRKAFIKAIENFDPKKFEEAAEKGMRLAIDKIKGKVR